MNSLRDLGCLESLQRRLQSLQPQTPRLWGQMTAPQMICHLTDSYLGVMGLRPIRPAGTIITRNLFRYVALHTSLKWPRGTPTLPEVDQTRGGTPPAEYAQDLAKLLALVDRFAAQPRDFEFEAHPILGPLTETEWMIWGFRHADHHLRQFGA